MGKRAFFIRRFVQTLFLLWVVLTLNLSRQPFADREFRRALDHAIDRRKFVDIALRGGATPARATSISAVLQPWHNPNLPLPEFNIDLNLRGHNAIQGSFLFES